MRIAQVIYANTWGDVTPQAFERGIGGREGALIRLAAEWAKLGHEVTNFVPTQKASRFEENSFKPNLGRRPKEEQLPSYTPTPFGFHEYIPIGLAKHMLASFPYDAVVAWECPQVFASDDVVEKQKVRLVHMQVAHLEDHESAEKYSTGVVALSEWAKEFLIHSGLSMSGDKMYVRPNGVNMTDYPLREAARGTSHQGTLSLVYSSSPDRGLWHLLRMWPKVRKEFQWSTLYVAYGVDKYVEYHKWLHNRLGQMSVDIAEGMKQPGIVDVGKIGQKELAKLQMKSNLWVYPADTIQATETGCITAIENMAAGNPCVMTDADCLKLEFGEVASISPLPFDQDDFLTKMDEASMPGTSGKMANAGREFALSRDWSKIAPTWIDLFEENRNGYRKTHPD
jgi:glycosyltransferase involved in cell wall biosynthesis